MAKMRLKKAQAELIALRTDAQTLPAAQKKEILELIKGLDAKTLDADEISQVKSLIEVARGAAPVPVVTPTGSTGSVGGPVVPEELKKHLESGAAGAAPPPVEKPKTPRARPAGSRYTFHPNMTGEFAYFRGATPVGDGSVKVVSIVLHGETHEQLMANAVKHMTDQGIKPVKTLVEGVFTNLFVQTIPNPTTGNTGAIDAKSLGDSIEARVRLDRKEAFKRVSEARKAGKGAEAVKALEEKVPPALLTHLERQTYDKAREVRAENKKAAKVTVATADTDDPELLNRRRTRAAEANTTGETRLLKLLEAKRGPDRALTPEERELLVARLGLSPSEVKNLSAAERSALSRMEAQLGAGNWAEALGSAKVIPDKKITKVINDVFVGAKPPASAVPTVTRETWQDPPELVERLKKAKSQGSRREMRVRYLFETGKFNVMGDDRASWIEENPAQWAKVKSNANAMRVLENAGKNRAIAMTKVTGDAFESSVLKPINVILGHSSEGDDIGTALATWGERSGSTFFDSKGNIKKGVSELDRMAAKHAGIAHTAERSRTRSRLADLEMKGATEEVLVKRLENYNVQLSKEEAKPSPDVEKRATLKRRIKQNEEDLNLVKAQREKRAAVTSAAAEGKRIPVVPHRETKRTLEQQLKSVQAKIDRLEKGHHPDEVHGPGLHEGKPRKIVMTKGWKERLETYKKLRQGLVTRMVSSAVTLATPDVAEAVAPAVAPVAAPAAAVPAPVAAAVNPVGSTLPNPYSKTGKWKPNPNRDPSSLKARAKGVMKGVGKGGFMRVLGPLAAIYGAYEIANLVKSGTIDEADARRMKAIEALGAVGRGMEADSASKDKVRQMQRMVDMASIQRQQGLDDMNAQFTGNQALDAMLRGQQASLAALAQPSRPSVAEMMARM